MDQDLITKQTNPHPQSNLLNDEEWNELLTLVKSEWDATTEEKYQEIWCNIYVKLRTLYNH